MEKNITVDVYTGTFGRMRIDDEEGVLHDIYLHSPNQYTRQIPGPMLVSFLIRIHTESF